MCTLLLRALLRDGLDLVEHVTRCEAGKPLIRSLAISRSFLYLAFEQQLPSERHDNGPQSEPLKCFGERLGKAIEGAAVDGVGLEEGERTCDELFAVHLAVHDHVFAPPPPGRQDRPSVHHDTFVQDIQPTALRKLKGRVHVRHHAMRDRDNELDVGVLEDPHAPKPRETGRFVDHVAAQRRREAIEAFDIFVGLLRERCVVQVLAHTPP
eukprot:5299401-Prymnesium_polylepis.1